jgi:hypothetical protein
VPRYFLNVRTSGELIVDEEGYECVDLRAAIGEAVRGARGLMSFEVQDGVLRLDQAIEIHNENNVLVATVEFADALQILPPRQDLPTRSQ